jgi:hypothetical protein
MASIHIHTAPPAQQDVCKSTRARSHRQVNETAVPTVERHLASTNYACVVIGAGVRLPPEGLALFEAVINAVRRGATGAAIAFNTRPEDSADAAARWIPSG